MKKFAVMVMVICFVLMGCGSTIPDDMNEKTYEKGKDALEIVEKYNNGDLSKGEAVERLENIYDYLESIDDSLSDDEQTQNLYVKIKISNCIGAINGNFEFFDDTYTVQEELEDELK